MSSPFAITAHFLGLYRETEGVCLYRTLSKSVAALNHGQNFPKNSVRETVPLGRLAGGGYGRQSCSSAPRVVKSSS